MIKDAESALSGGADLTGPIQPPYVEVREGRLPTAMPTSYGIGDSREGSLPTAMPSAEILHSVGKTSSDKDLFSVMDLHKFDSMPTGVREGLLYTRHDTRHTDR